MPSQRVQRNWAYLAVSILGAAAIVYAPVFLVGRPVHGPIDPTRVVVWTLAAGLAMAWAVSFGVLVFRNQDEFAQQASRVGWYWGATLGLAVSLPAFVFIALGGLHWLWPGVPAGRELERAFVAGYYRPVLLQAAGFLVARGWWRLSKR